MTSEEVRAAFVWQTMEAMGRVWTDDHCAYTTRQMADEIVRLREQLAAVTVTEAMVRAAFVRLYPGCGPDEMQHYHAADIRAALTAALTHPTTPTRGSDE